MLYATLIIIVFISMEGISWFMHKYIMHGFLWYLHASHHESRPATKHKSWQHNDWFGIFFSLLSVGLFYFGIKNSWLFAVGIGITLYGMCYLLVHDVWIHGRFHNSRTFIPKNAYARRILRAHRLHHGRRTKEAGLAFGFLYASQRYEYSAKTRRDDIQTND